MLGALGTGAESCQSGGQSWQGGPSELPHTRRYMVVSEAGSRKGPSPGPEGGTATQALLCIPVTPSSSEPMLAPSLAQPAPVMHSCRDWVGCWEGRHL